MDADGDVVPTAGRNGVITLQDTKLNSSLRHINALLDDILYKEAIKILVTKSGSVEVNKA